MNNLLPPLLVRDAIAKLDEAVLGIEQLRLHGKVQLLRARSILAKVEKRLSEELATTSFEKVLAPRLRQEKVQEPIGDEQGEDVDGNE